MADTNNFKDTVGALFKGMDGVVSSKTVVGEAIHTDGVTILPLLDVSFGLGAGAFDNDKKERTGGGIGGKITPSAVLVIKDGTTRLVNIKNQDTMTKLLDMVPGILEKLTTRKEDTVTEEDVAEMLDDAEKRQKELHKHK